MANLRQRIEAATVSTRVAPTPMLAARTDALPAELSTATMRGTLGGPTFRTDPTAKDTNNLASRATPGTGVGSDPRVFYGMSAAQKKASDEMERLRIEKVRPRGRMSTIYAGTSSMMTNPSVSRRSLMGA